MCRSARYKKFFYYAKLCRACDMSNGLIPRSPLANRFSKYVSGPQNWYLGICNSKERAFIARFNILDIHCNSLSMAPDHQYAFDDTINYSVLDTGNIGELALICSDNLSHNWSMQLRNSRNKTIFGMYFNCSVVKLCTSLSDMMRNILITEQFRPTFINRTALYYFQ